MPRIKEQYVNVRVTTTGAGQDGSDTVQYFNGTDWVDYLTVYQYEGNMKSKRDRTVDALRRKYDTKRVYYVRNSDLTASNKYVKASQDVYDATPCDLKYYQLETI